jgi:steroid delta-isomerase-like uncharacterized protein
MATLFGRALPSPSVPCLITGRGLLARQRVQRRGPGHSPSTAKEIAMITAQDTALIVRKLYDSFNQRDFDQIGKLAADGAQFLNVPLGVTYNGPAGAKEFAQGWATAFPDSKVEVTNLIATDEWVVSEFIGRGTHKGPLNGPGGAIPPTGKRLEMRFVEVFRIKNGKISEHRAYFDAATMMRQLGLMGDPSHR